MPLVISRNAARQPAAYLDTDLDSVDVGQGASAQIERALVSVWRHFHLTPSAASGHVLDVRDYLARGEIVGEFNAGMGELAALVAAIHDGQVPAHSDDLRASADRALGALARQNVSVDEWARQLAEDVSHLAD